jgi:hypothetical protein
MKRFTTAGAEDAVAAQRFKKAMGIKTSDLRFQIQYLRLLLLSYPLLCSLLFLRW